MGFSGAAQLWIFLCVRKRSERSCLGCMPFYFCCTIFITDNHCNNKLVLFYLLMLSCLSYLPIMGKFKWRHYHLSTSYRICFIKKHECCSNMSWGEGETSLWSCKVIGQHVLSFYWLYNISFHSTAPLTLSSIIDRHMGCCGSDKLIFFKWKLLPSCWGATLKRSTCPGDNYAWFVR